MGKLVSRYVTKWKSRGATPVAVQLVDRPGWVLTICGREKWALFLLSVVFSLAGIVCVILLLIPPFKFDSFTLAAFVYFFLWFASVSYYRYISRLQVTLDEDGITVPQYLSPDETMRWADIASFEYSPKGESLDLHAIDGRTISLYLSLNGLSAVRRCIAAFSSVEMTRTSWEEVDHLLMTNVPSWWCDTSLLGNNPFDPY